MTPNAFWKKWGPGIPELPESYFKQRYAFMYDLASVGPVAFPVPPVGTPPAARVVSAPATPTPIARGHMEAVVAGLDALFSTTAGKVIRIDLDHTDFLRPAIATVYFAE